MDVWKVQDDIQGGEYNAPINVTPHPPCTGIAIGGDLTHRMCQIPTPQLLSNVKSPPYIYTRAYAQVLELTHAQVKSPTLGRNFVANPLPSPTPIPYRGGVGHRVADQILSHYHIIYVFVFPKHLQYIP